MKWNVKWKPLFWNLSISPVRRKNERKEEGTRDGLKDWQKENKQTNKNSTLYLRGLRLPCSVLSHLITPVGFFSSTFESYPWFSIGSVLDASWLVGWLFCIASKGAHANPYGGVASNARSLPTSQPWEDAKISLANYKVASRLIPVGFPSLKETLCLRLPVSWMEGKRLMIMRGFRPSVVTHTHSLGTKDVVFVVCVCVFPCVCV